jgi:hypothetical protein
LLDSAQPKLAVKSSNLKREGRILRYDQADKSNRNVADGNENRNSMNNTTKPMQILACGPDSFFSSTTPIPSKTTAITTMDEPPNASVSKGCIDQRYGRPLSLLLDAIRFLAAKELIGVDDVHTIRDIERMHYSSSSCSTSSNNGQQSQSTPQHAHATTRLNYFLAIAWSRWNDPGPYCRPHADGSSGSMMEIARRFVQEEWLDDLDRLIVPVADPVTALEFQQHKDMVQFCADAFDHIRAVKSWHIRIQGDFWIVSGDDQGTYLIPQKNEDMVYQCVGLSTSLHGMIQKKYGSRPMVWKVTLIPFYGRLVYDGVVTLGSGGSSTTSGSSGTEGRGGLAMAASESKRRRLLETVHEAKHNRRVIQRLLQLEVEGGSIEGLSTHGLVATVQNRDIASRCQPPPTIVEQRLLTAYIRLEGPILSSDDPKGLWVFRRKGYTEQQNPDHIGFILGRDEVMGYFRCSRGLQPTSTDILEATLDATTKAGIRPHSIMSDDYTCFERLKFLFENVLKDNTTTTRIDYYHPPTPEETAAAVVSADDRPF